MVVRVSNIKNTPIAVKVRKGKFYKMPIACVSPLSLLWVSFSLHIFELWGSICFCSLCISVPLWVWEKVYIVFCSYLYNCPEDLNPAFSSHCLCSPRKMHVCEGGCYACNITASWLWRYNPHPKPKGQLIKGGEMSAPVQGSEKYWSFSVASWELVHFFQYLLSNIPLEKHVLISS